ncbi:hypothetical protein [Moorena producens]|uniref:hypothetical protein n=1 Tax=Moorena producens TaxID=1155739 RepID=UPI003C7945D6
MAKGHATRTTLAKGHATRTTLAKGHATRTTFNRLQPSTFNRLTFNLGQRPRYANNLQPPSTAFNRLQPSTVKTLQAVAT